MPKVKSLVDGLRYGDGVYNTGDEFEARPRDAKVLQVLKKVSAMPLTLPVGAALETLPPVEEPVAAPIVVQTPTVTVTTLPVTLVVPVVVQEPEKTQEQTDGQQTSDAQPGQSGSESEATPPTAEGSTEPVDRPARGTRLRTKT